MLWSAGGGDYARRRAIEHGVAEFFSEFHLKQRADGGFLAAEFLADPLAATFIDDHPEDLTTTWLVWHVPPYVAPDPHDAAMSELMAMATAQRA